MNSSTESREDEYKRKKEKFIVNIFSWSRSMGKQCKIYKDHVVLITKENVKCLQKIEMS